ncbi:LPS export ABC transporter permease LptF [Chromatiales bacterium (ex Bugula neritina AB1)]|nr:LPS export ABC transporter permease LptF [Chromatiales bacterium (ex Bugula neritina AB1)]
MLKALDRYIFREISITWFAVTVVLLVIMVANVLARILSKVTEGLISADVLFMLVGLKVINLLVTLIPLGLYLGVLLAFGRLYRDSEMSAIAACGTGLKALYRPVIVNGLIGVILISVLTFWASPWAARFEQRITERAADQSVTSLLSAGRFVEILGGSAVVFTESLSADKNEFQQVFVHRDLDDEGSFEVETARSAIYQRDEDTDSEFIVFVDGESITSQAGGSSYQRTRFSRHGIRLPDNKREMAALENSAKTFTELWQSDDQQSKAEIQWRVSIPLAAMLLALLAVPLSHTSPRQGRYSKIAVAILIYVPYANLLVLSRKWLAAGTIPPVVGLWWVHILFFFLIVFFTIRRYGFSWFFYRSAVTT